MFIYCHVLYRLKSLWKARSIPGFRFLDLFSLIWNMWLSLLRYHRWGPRSFCQHCWGVHSCSPPAIVLQVPTRNNLKFTAALTRCSCFVSLTSDISHPASPVVSAVLPWLRVSSLVRGNKQVEKQAGLPCCSCLVFTPWLPSMMDWDLEI